MFGTKFLKSYASIVLIGLFVSCSNTTSLDIDQLIATEDVEALRDGRKDIQGQISELQSQIEKIDDYLDKISGDEGLALVSIEDIKTQSFKHFIEVQADIATDENILIFSEMSGVIQQLPIKKGQQVSRGQILAVLDDGGMQSQLAQFQVQESLAKTIFERQQNLWNQNIGSEVQFLEAKTNYEAAQNAVKQIQRQIDKSIVRAPFSGVVDELLVEHGQLSLPGQTPLLRLVSLKNLYIDAHIPENHIASVEKGAEVEVRINGLAEEFTAKIDQVGAHINPNNRTFSVRIPIGNSIELARPNQIATVKINDYANDEAILISDKVIQVNTLGEAYVYVLNVDDKNREIAKRKFIELGMTQNGQTEVLSGLSSSDKIIVEGARSIRDGQGIKILN